MPRRLDIGIASYGAPDLLRRTIESVIARSRTDWRLIVVDNPHPRDVVGACALLKEYKERLGARLYEVYLSENMGYAYAVSRIQQLAETEYIAYLDNDVDILSDGWDETLCGYLDRFHEIGMIFPNGGSYPIHRGAYQEVMWGIGFAWVLSRLAMTETGLFDYAIGHQQEADYALRLRMAGWKCAAAPEVQVDHLAKATSERSAESGERIARGIREWVDKWCKYFCGKNVNYHSPNVLRWEDWPPNALYLEEYWKLRTPDLNAAPEEYAGDGTRELIKVPRLKGFYTGRIV